MKKNDVKGFKPGSAQNVVMHAIWRKSRGKRLAQPYREERNPQKALSKAIEKVIEPMAGEDIRTTASNAVKFLHLTGSNFFSFQFNEITLKVNKCSTTQSIYDDFRAQCKERSRKYWASPKGQAKIKRRKEEAQRLNLEARKLELQLPFLRYQDVEAVLNWFEKYQDPSDHIRVKIPREHILRTFEQRGFLPGVYCREEFKLKDRDIHARWIIGQCLSCLKEIGAIHHITKKFIQDWREMFSLEHVPVNESPSIHFVN